MKVTSPIVFLAAALLAGCTGGNSNNGSQQQQTNAASSGNPLTAPVDYLGAVANAKQHSVKVIDTAYVSQAIQMFNVEEGRNPTNLNELVAKKYLGEIPKAPYGQKLVYDPATGKVSVIAAK